MTKDSSSCSFTETADIETASEDYASRFSGEVGQYFLDVQKELTLSALIDFPRATVLEIGGGHAQLARPLIDEGFQLTVTGSDETCRKRLDMSCEPGSFEFISCDSLQLPFEENEFDVVMAFRLLPHANNWQGLLGEMCRVARKRVVFDYPDRRSTNILYDVLFDLKKNMEGNTRTFTLFSRKEISRQLEIRGFKSTVFTPEFLLPMVVHRKLKSASFSRFLESVFRNSKLTHYFGSPIVFHSDAQQSL